MSTFNPAEMLKKLIRRQQAFESINGFPPRISDFSGELRQQIQEHVRPRL